MIPRLDLPLACAQLPPIDRRSLLAAITLRSSLTIINARKAINRLIRAQFRATSEDPSDPNDYEA